MRNHSASNVHNTKGTACNCVWTKQILEDKNFTEYKVSS